MPPPGIWLTVWHVLCIYENHRNTEAHDLTIPADGRGLRKQTGEGWNMKTNWRIWAMAGVIAVGGLALGTSPAKAQGFGFSFSTGPGYYGGGYPLVAPAPVVRGSGPGHRPAALRLPPTVLQRLPPVWWLRLPRRLPVADTEAVMVAVTEAATVAVTEADTDIDLHRGRR